MASYAAIASRGPKQTPEEAAAPQLAEIEPSETSVGSLIDVDSGVSVVDSDFREHEIKTETQAHRREIEEEVAEEEAEARAKAESVKKDVKKKAKVAGKKAEDYTGNPVYATNAVLSTILAITLGVNAYNKYKVGQFSWKLVGIYTGAIAAFGAVDFYATKFANQKYAESKSK